jgi:hypothetical protein
MGRLRAPPWRFAAAKATRTPLRFASLMLTTEAMIADIPEKKPRPARPTAAARWIIRNSPLPKVFSRASRATGRRGFFFAVFLGVRQRLIGRGSTRMAMWPTLSA